MAKLASCPAEPAVAPRRRSRTLARKTATAKATVYIALYMRSDSDASVGISSWLGGTLSAFRQADPVLARAFPACWASA